MRELSVQETKEIELAILLQVDKFCKANNLQYFLAYGTLIGAVRHNGFIPWDDDIDIVMSRDDYNWMIHNYNKMNPNGRYRLISPFMPESKHSFVKIIDTYTVKTEPDMDYKHGNLGVDIDIFPLDGQPDDDEVFEKWYSQLMKIYKYYGLCLLKAEGSLKRRIGVPLIRIMTGGRKNLLRRAAKLHNKYPYKESRYVGSIECLYVYRGDRHEKNCVERSVEADFEGYKFPIPAGYDKILTNIYGNYMQLPPEEKRITHHSNRTYLKDTDMR